MFRVGGGESEDIAANDLEYGRKGHSFRESLRWDIERGPGRGPGSRVVTEIMTDFNHITLSDSLCKL